MDTSTHSVLASTFADYPDLVEFIKCLTPQTEGGKGLSFDQALSYGDNGVGKWGAVTAQEDVPMCALPPEDWLSLNNAAIRSGDAASHYYKGAYLRFHASANAKGQKVEVVYTPDGGTPSRPVVGQLQDTMPHKDNIKPGGALIDLNPAFVKALGFPPNSTGKVTWRFV